MKAFTGFNVNRAPNQGPQSISPTIGKIDSSSTTWKSITDMLIQNRCWICRQQFPKGRTRGVFMISDILTYFGRRIDDLSASADVNREEIFDSVSVSTLYASDLEIGEAEQQFLIHLDGCWLRYCALRGDMSNIEKDLASVELQLWMSGLVCMTSEECDKMYRQIIPDTEQTSTGVTIRKATLASMAKDACPPGCNCDNPWPFLVPDEVSSVSPAAPKPAVVPMQSAEDTLPRQSSET